MPEAEFRTPTEMQLHKRLQELPRNIAPDRDLWPEIEQTMLQPQRRWLPIAIAAGLAAISLTLALKFIPGSTEEKWLTTPLVGNSPEWMQEATNLQQIKAGLQSTMQQQLALLDPQTRRVVVENLTIIEQARHNISDALQMRPQSTALSNQYRQLWQQEMAIYRQVSSYSYKM